MLLDLREKMKDQENSGILSITVVLLLVISGIYPVLNFNAEGAGPPVSRKVNGEKGSIQEVDLADGDLTDLMINKDNAIELTQEVGEVKEEFESLDSVYYQQNVIPVEGASMIQHSFRKTHGGIGTDSAERSILTSDGGYALTGSASNPMTGDRLLLMKLDRNGEHLWTRSFGSGWGHYGYDLIETSGGDLVVVGTTYSNEEKGNDIWLIRTDKNGIEIWNYTYDIQYIDEGYGIVETSDGKFAICGTTFDWYYYQPELVVMMVEPTGEEIWNETYGDKSNQVGRDIIETQDGSLMVIGYSQTPTGFLETTLWKITTSGNETWNQSYGAQGMLFQGVRLDQLTGGDIMSLSYSTTSIGGSMNFILMRTTSDGKVIWSKSYGSSGNNQAVSMTINATGITMVGSSDATGSGGEDVFIVRADLSGTQKWTTYYGGGSRDKGVEALPSIHGLYVIGNSQSWGPGPQGIFVLNLTHDGGGNEGKFVSKDVLSGITTSGLIEMEYYADIPPDASIRIRFSNDLINWYDSSGTLDAYTTLSSWDGKVVLSDLEGFDQRFHYELSFSCDKGDIAEIGPLTMTYSFKPEFGHLVTEAYEFDYENIDWRNIGIDLDIPQGTDAKVQIRTGSTNEELSTNDFIGPDGTASSVYDPDEAIWEGHDGERFIQVMVNLSTTDVSITPILYSLNFTYDFIGEIMETKVVYDKGDIDDTYNFTIVFSDMDNDEPDLVRVQIDGENITMKIADDDPYIKYKKKFYHQTQFTAGDHSYRFFIEYGALLLSTEPASLEVAPGPLHVIEVTPRDITVTSDEVISFSASGYDRQGNDLDFEPTWEVTGGGIIDQAGNFTPNQVGTWTVYVNLSGISGHANFTVAHGILATIEVSMDTYSITADESVQMVARGFDSDGNEIEISPTWTIEGGGTIDQTGLFSGDIPGMWKIYASVGELQVFEVIEVKPGALHSIEVEPSKVTLNISETVTFSASGFDSDGNPVTFESGWRAGGGGLMHASGIFTAETPGTWKIYCNTSGVSGEATVTINPPISGDDDDDDIVPHGGRDKGGGLPGLVIVLIIVIILLFIIGILVLTLMIRKKIKSPMEQQLSEGMMPAQPGQQLPIQGTIESFPPAQQPAPGWDSLPVPEDAEIQDGQQPLQPYPIEQPMEQPLPVEQSVQQESAPKQSSIDRPPLPGDADVTATNEQVQDDTTPPAENVPLTSEPN